MSRDGVLRKTHRDRTAQSVTAIGSSIQLTMGLMERLWEPGHFRTVLLWGKENLPNGSHLLAVKGLPCRCQCPALLGATGSPGQSLEKQEPVPVYSLWPSWLLGEWVPRAQEQAETKRPERPRKGVWHKEGGELEEEMRRHSMHAEGARRRERGRRNIKKQCPRMFTIWWKIEFQIKYTWSRIYKNIYVEFPGGSAG